MLQKNIVTVKLKKYSIDKPPKKHLDLQDVFYRFKHNTN